MAWNKLTILDRRKKERVIPFYRRRMQLTTLNRWEMERVIPFYLRRIRRYVYLRTPLFFPSSLTKTLGALKVLVCVAGYFLVPHVALLWFSLTTVVGSVGAYVFARSYYDERFPDGGILFALEEGAWAATKGAVVIFLILVTIDFVWWKTEWYTLPLRLIPW
jgi:hypothetical protein